MEEGLLLAFLIVVSSAVVLLTVLFVIQHKKIRKIEMENEELNNLLSVFGAISSIYQYGIVTWINDELVYINSKIIEHADLLELDLKSREQIQRMLDNPEDYLTIYDILKDIREHRDIDSDYTRTWNKEIGKKYFEITYLVRIQGDKKIRAIITKDSSFEYQNIERQILSELIDIISSELSKSDVSIKNLGESIRKLLLSQGLIDTFGIAFLEPNGYIYYPYFKYVDDDDKSGMRFGPEVKNLTRYVIDKNIKVHIRNSKKEQLLPEGYSLYKVRGELFTIYAVPIAYRSLVRGAVLFEKQGEDQFSDITINLFDKVVNMITLAFSFLDVLREVDEERRKLFELSIKDYLTGAYSRRFLEQYLEKELFKSKRMKTPLSVVFIDINDFKKINDIYGHVYGDNVLKMFVKIANETIRSMDLIARYGGDEFVIVLPETGVENAQKVIDRIIDRLKEENINISYGIIDASEYGSIDDVYKKVDEKMYEMKKKKNL
ncbi:MAG: GGDEF domain-containing protein [Fervidobacterium nodosum]